MHIRLISQYNKVFISHGINPKIKLIWIRKLAEVSVGEYMLMSIMGWTNPTQAKKYIEKASRAKMAKLGMDMLSGEHNKD